jgi:hypothetical protein
VRLIRFSAAPPEASPVQRENFKNVQIDAVGIGLANAAAPFLPVFLTRLGATNFQVGMLTSMPALTGLFLALAVGRFLQARRNIVPWFSAARLMVVSAYALTGLVTLLVPADWRVAAVLVIWAAATLPQTVVAVGFSVVMNAVAGPGMRYNLMSRRWSILGLTTALTVLGVSQLLHYFDFPINYQIIFLGLSLGGLVSYYFSSHIKLPDVVVTPTPRGVPMRERMAGIWSLVQSQPHFIRFSLQRFVFMSGVMLAVPIFPLYYVREVDASDAEIAFISLAQTVVLLAGYFMWTRWSQLRGGRFVLLWTTFGMAVYPLLVASTHQVALIILFAALAGIFQAGLDLVFFDELMRTFPPEQSATFVSLAQSMQHFSAVLAPLLGTALAGVIGLGGALVVSAVLRLLGFLLFALWTGPRRPDEDEHIEPLPAPPVKGPGSTQNK